MRRLNYKKLIIYVFALVIFYFLFFFESKGEIFDPGDSISYFSETVYGTSGLVTYDEYLRNHPDASVIDAEIDVDLSSCSKSGMTGQYDSGYSVSGGYYDTDEIGDLVCIVNVQTEGLYNIFVEYIVPNGVSKASPPANGLPFSLV